jgi:hypothetical protein
MDTPHFFNDIFPSPISLLRPLTTRRRKLKQRPLLIPLQWHLGLATTERM